jgi:hypothetical protein
MIKASDNDPFIFSWSYNQNFQVDILKLVSVSN